MKEKLKDKLKKIFKNHKLIIILVSIVIIFTTISLTFGKYIYNNIQNFYYSTQKFYFNSDKLRNPRADYQLTNWSGVDNFTININMNSIKNNLIKAKMDITYDITFTCPNTVTCQASKTNGTIYYQNVNTPNSDDFSIIVSPNQNAGFVDGDRVTILVSATSTSPYTKTLSAVFVLKVGTMALSYEIDDSVGSPYLEMRITNTIDYYKVVTAFGSYQVGDRIDISTYKSLAITEQNNCASAIISLAFDPNVVLLDMTNPSYLARNSQQITTIGGYDYINKYYFKMDAISSEIVKFYKVDPSIDYTYPYTTQTPIITFNSGFNYNF